MRDDGVVTLAATGEVPPELARQFVDGLVVRHEDGTEVRFSDDTWVIRITKGARGQMSLKFGKLPLWARRYTKLFLAHQWLSAGHSISSVRGALSGVQYGVKALKPFNGPSIEDLNEDHVDRVRAWLAVRFDRGVEALGRAEREEGGALSQRKTKEVLRQAKALGPRSVYNCVRALNNIVHVARSHGAKVDVQFARPPHVKHLERRAGGADPKKVLSEDELAAIILAAQADIDEFYALLQGSARVEQKSRPGFSVVNGEESYDRIARWLGLDGYQVTNSNEVARHYGVAPAGFNRTLKRSLVEAVGEDLAGRIVELRGKKPKRPTKRPLKRWVDAEIELRELLAAVDLREKFLVERNHVYHKALEAVYGLNGQEKLSVEAAARKFDLAPDMLRSEAATRSGRFLAHARHRSRPATNSELRRARARAIKACALLLLVTTFRRVAAPLLSLRRDFESREVEHRGSRLFGIRLRSYKVWGDEGLDEWVEIPDFHGQVARKALETALELTEPLREFASSEEQNFLFLLPDRWKDRPTVLKPKLLHVYIWDKRSGSGLFQRRKVPRGEEISIHHFRHTHATAIVTSGGSAVTVARILGNDPTTALTSYVAMGSEPGRAQARSLVEQVGAQGYLFDAVLRVRAELGEGLDVSLPAAQLTLEQAMQRLRDNPTLLGEVMQGDEEPSAEVVARFLDRGLVLNLTSKGACLLPVEEGPCPASEECPIGCDPERSSQDPGCGCRWQVLVPHDDAVSTLTSDLDAMRLERDTLGEQKGYEVWVQHYDKRIACWEAQVETMLSLRAKAGLS